MVANKYFIFTLNTLGQRGLLSDIVESLCMSVENPFEIISSEDLLARISSSNKEIEKKKRTRIMAGERNTS